MSLQSEPSRTPLKNPPLETNLTRGLLFFMAAACGMTVANLYYNQPLLTELQNAFQVGFAEIGRIPMLTQLGYACGMLFLTPLGDRYDRKRLIVFFTSLTAAALLIAAASTGFVVFELSSFLIGLSAVGAQIIIPHVAQLAPANRRGEAVGKVMTGLLLGILLSRTLSGFIGSIFGWRSVFALSSGLMLAMAAVMVRILPRSEPSFSGSYLKLMGSLFDLARSERVLRQSALIGACLFASFSAVWATLIFLLSSESFHMGAKAAGLFGLLGAAGAMSAALVGRAADRLSPLRTLRLALVVTFGSFVGLALSGTSLIGLIIGIFVMDAGVQAAHVSNQARFFSIRPEARSRMNTVYMFLYFVGGALGSYLGATVWPHWQWLGVCGVSLAFIALALGIAFYERK